jgi:hypothetical protein
MLKASDTGTKDCTTGSAALIIFRGWCTILPSFTSTLGPPHNLGVAASETKNHFARPALFFPHHRRRRPPLARTFDAPSPERLPSRLPPRLWPRPARESRARSGFSRFSRLLDMTCSRPPPLVTFDPYVLRCGEALIPNNSPN